MKKENKSFIVVIVVILVLVVAVAIGAYTYARYITTWTGTGSVNIAKWAVSLNGTSATSASETVNVSFTVDDNDYVSANYIAPGATATAQLVLDPSGSQVAIDYTVTIDLSDIYSSNEQIVVKSVTSSLTGSMTASSVSGNVYTYTGSLSLSQVEANTSETFTVTIEWANDESNNSTDTATGITAGTISVPVTVTAQQHID